MFAHRSVQLESFISAMGEIPTVTVIGDTTGGSTGNPEFFPLRDGWSYAVPRWMAYTADLRVIEWNGIPPDILVPVTREDFAAGRDPVLEFALEWARQYVPYERVSWRRCAAPPRPCAPTRSWRLPWRLPNRLTR